MPGYPQEAIEAIRRLLDRSQSHEALHGSPDPLASSPGEGLPPVAPPPAFRPYPEVIGSPRLHRTVAELLRTVPDATGRFKSVKAAPTRGAMEAAMKAGFNPSELPGLNLLGQYDRKSGEVYVNPSYAQEQPGYEPLGTILAHEIGHAVGNNHDPSRFEELEKLGGALFTGKATIAGIRKAKRLR